jgi:integrase
MLSPAQARSILESVARAHLAKMERVAVLESADGVTADEGRSSDRVMGWARRLQAAQGMAATAGAAERRLMAEYGLTQQEIDEVGQTLDLLRRASNGTSPRRRLATLLEQCGAPQGEGDLLQAERIYYRGQAAALLATERRWSGDFRDDGALIDQLLRKEPLGDVKLPTPMVSNVSSGPTESKIPPLTSEAQALQVAQDPPTKETSIKKLTEKMIGEKAALEEWNDKTQRQVRSLIDTFVEMIGDDHVRSLSQRRVAEYRSLLLALPRSYGKGQHDKETPLAVWLERAKGMKREEKGRAAGTLNRHLSQLQEVLVYIAAQGHKISDFTGVSNLRAKQNGRARDQRNPFSPEDLVAIFRQPPWTGCASFEDRMSPGVEVYHDAMSIVPYLARYTLARREEICGLEVEDVLEENGIPYIFIRPNEHRPVLKNAQSMRRVPLIDEVARLGFLRYHAEIKRLGYRLLFPELRAASDRTPFGDVFYGDWIKIQNAAVPNATEERKAFHSFRKVGGADLKDALVPSELRADILGHGGTNVTEERYASAAKLEQVLGVLQLLPIVTGHIVTKDIFLRPDVLQKRKRPSAKPRRLTRES